MFQSCSTYLIGTDIEGKVPLLEFSFFAYGSPNQKNKYDPRISTTIVSIIADFFSAFPTGALIVTYDSTDGKARNRKVAFRRWYNQASSGDLIERYDDYINISIDNIVLRIDCSLLVKSDNPYRNSILKGLRGFIRLAASYK